MMYGRWENWGWWKMPDEQPEKEPQPKSYDVGLISPCMRGFLLELARKHNPTTSTSGIKKAAVDLLETAQPTDMEPGRLAWSELEAEAQRMGPHWGLADIWEVWEKRGKGKKR